MGATQARRSLVIAHHLTERLSLSAHQGGTAANSNLLRKVSE
jgi:hypothetical protein